MGKPVPRNPGLDPDCEAYDAQFARWAKHVARFHHLAHPHIPPYPLEAFDGCSGVPDDARECCLSHDVRYWFCETPRDRLMADRMLRDCLIAKGRFDPGWRWLWCLRGWTVFTGVRLFGWLYAGKGSRRGR